MKLLFAHGWGFDQHVWQPLAAQLPECDQERDDRGYFVPTRHREGDNASHDLPPCAQGEPILAVTHSFGTMRVLADPPPGLAGIVAINGFDHFTPGVPIRVVDRMLRRFATDPRGVLADFRAACGCRDAFDAIAPEPLRADLLRLRDDRPPMPRVPILAVQGGRDPILPAEMRETVFAGCTVRRLELPGAGHLLPVEAPDFCARAVREALGTLS